MAATYILKSTSIYDGISDGPVSGNVVIDGNKILGTGSDYPVVHFSPARCIYAAVTRKAENAIFFSLIQLSPMPVPLRHTAQNKSHTVPMAVLSLYLRG